MASFTENLGLKKPDRTDKFSIEDFNSNADIIDTIPDIVSGASTAVGTAYVMSCGNVGISGKATVEEEQA